MEEELKELHAFINDLWQTIKQTYTSKFTEETIDDDFRRICGMSETIEQNHRNNKKVNHIVKKMLTAYAGALDDIVRGKCE